MTLNASPRRGAIVSWKTRVSQDGGEMVYLKGFQVSGQGLSEAGGVCRIGFHNSVLKRAL